METFRIILKSETKKFKSFLINEGNETFAGDNNIFILDNGGVPFIVNLNNKVSRIYKREFDYEYDKIFTGEGESKNSSVLLKVKDEYIYIGSEIYKFKTEEDKIIDYKTPVGNSAVPYPVAIGEKYLYFMLDKLYIDKDEIEETDDYYREFYDKEKDLKTNKLKDLKIIVKRL